MSNRLAGCQSLFCAWCGLMRPTRSVTHASVGLSGSATQRPIWLRLLWDTLCASGRSMGIALTNRRCCGKPLVCGPQSSLSAGVTWSPLCITIWCWPATWFNQNCAHGKTSSASRPHSRCDAGCTNCWHVWVSQPGYHNLAENRKAAVLGSRLARPCGFRSFARHQNCPRWSQSNDFADFFIRSGSFHGTSCEVLGRVVSLNVNNSRFAHFFVNLAYGAYLFRLDPKKI